MNCIEKRNEGHVSFLTINRPRELNALNLAVLNDIDRALDDIHYPTTRCLVMQGEGGKAFSIGAEVSEMLNMQRDEALSFGQFGNRVFSKLSELECPTIALIQGFALGGGCELAMACDIRIASKTAILGLPETSLGIIPGFGGTQRLSRIVGLSKAKELVFTGERVFASEALRIGLVDEVFSNRDVLEKTIEIAEKIAENAPTAIKFAKRVMNEGANTDLEHARKLETQSFSRLFETEEQIERMTAYLNKQNQ